MTYNPKYPFYQLYSWWALFLLILYLCGIIKFSILPTYIGIIIGVFVFLYIKYQINKSKNKKSNINFVIILIIIHVIPVLFIPHTISFNDLIYNLLIFIAYLFTLEIQNTNVIKVYKKLIYEQDSNASMYNYYKDLGVLV